ncbi:MAG: hypothetical protein MRZ45_09355 [Blautia sp.]|nr:hypothetical protein [Blautia sp.]
MGSINEYQRIIIEFRKKVHSELKGQCTYDTEKGLNKSLEILAETEADVLLEEYEAYAYPGENLEKGGFSRGEI